MKSSLQRLLLGVGKKYFIENYFKLKNNTKTNDEGYAEKAFYSRVSKSKKIFEANLQILALQMCIETQRLGNNVIEKAKEILNKEIEKEFEIDFIESTKGYRLTKYIGNNTNVILPKYYNNFKIKEVVNPEIEFFPIDYHLESLYIPNSIESINHMGFYAMIKLERVVFEEDSNLKLIGSYAFGHSHSLKEITIPKSVREIGDYSFAWSGLEEFVIEDNSLLEKTGMGVFDYSEKLKK